MHPVIQVVMERARKRSLPGHRDDGFKVGLAIEGGSMRGVVSAGMVTALHALGLTQTFDTVYGTSAGAINGAYFLSGQPSYGTTIYYENINNNNFIDLRRLFSSRPIASLEYIFEDVMVRQKILDWKAVIESPVPLKAIASSVTLRKSVVLSDFGDRNDLFTALKASSRMPGITGPPVAFRGDTFFDGSVYESVPYIAAKYDGCTHVLALLTRPANCRLSKSRWVDANLIGPWVRKYSREMYPDIAQQRTAYLAHLDELRCGTENPDSPPFLYAVRCREGCGVVGRLEKQRERLVAGAKRGMEAVLEVFSGRRFSVLEHLSPFDEFGHFITRPTSDLQADAAADQVKSPDPMQLRAAL